MSGEATDAVRVAARRSVVVIGNHSLQNRLLAGLIEERGGCSCVLRSGNGHSGLPVAPDALVLLDIEGLSAPHIDAQLHAISTHAHCDSIGVINADENVAFADIVTWPGVKGVFFRDTSQENLVKGIQAIFNGDYWLPRKLLCQHLERTRVAQRPATTEATSLTRKELETLKLLATGNSTTFIASKLNVSTHTVKTHIYNLFRKIGVKNRVQAAQWAMRNIDVAQQSQGQAQR
jgi:DNA-binding NarL/FixJ family response regulator